MKRTAPTIAAASDHAHNITNSIAVLSSVFQVIAFRAKIVVMVDCIDNADNADANGVLRELFNLAHPSKSWVAVASRQGTPKLWEGMNYEQKLELKPLAVNMAMVALWRWKYPETYETTSDIQAHAQLELLEAADIQEYESLETLVERLGL